mmetsp:Transcript_22233/g.54791  ORF Transcript_22233/g.54791 Transcript_22233/m.54791 type:complete len:382 (-) Transcript_22233:5-1150(-)
MVLLRRQVLKNVTRNAGVALGKRDICQREAKLRRALHVKHGALLIRLIPKGASLKHLGHLEVHISPKLAAELADRVALRVRLLGEVRKAPVMRQLLPIHVLVLVGVVGALLEGGEAKPLAEGIVAVSAEELGHPDDACVADAKVLVGRAVDLWVSPEIADALQVNDDPLATAHDVGEVREGVRGDAIVCLLDEAVVGAVLLVMPLDELLGGVQRGPLAPLELEHKTLEKVDAVRRLQTIELISHLLGEDLHLTVDVVDLPLDLDVLLVRLGHVRVRPAQLRHHLAAVQLTRRPWKVCDHGLLLHEDLDAVLDKVVLADVKLPASRHLWLLVLVEDEPARGELARLRLGLGRGLPEAHEGRVHRASLGSDLSQRGTRGVGGS